MEDKDLKTTNEEYVDIESMIKMTQHSSNARFNDNSLHDSLLDTGSRIDEIAKRSTVIQDHYSNTLTATGDADKVESFTSYGLSNDTLNYVLWLSLYNDSWIFRRAIDKPAQDEVNSGFTLYGDDDFTRVYKMYDRYKSELTQILMWGALFGGSVGVIMFDGIGKTDMEKPLSKKAIKGKQFKIYVTDRWYGGFAKTDKMVTNMKDIDYGKPMFYEITFPDGGTYKIHHSYILRYEHRVAPSLIKNGQLSGWGYAEGSHIINELSRDDQLKSSITSLVNKSLIEVIKMSGMRGAFMGTDKGNEAQLRKRLEMVNWGRTYNSLTFLDKDDDYQQYNMSALSGLADLLEKNMWLISSALEMQGILYGDLKGGLSQNTDDYKRYSQTILNRCNSYYRPVLTKFLKIVFIVLDIKSNVDFDFNNLNYVEENKDKVDAIDSLSQCLSKLTQDGVISKYEYANSLKQFMNNDAIHINISDEFLNKLKLEEEQNILDTIEFLNKKGRNIDKPNFNTNFNSNTSSNQFFTPNEDIQEEYENNDLNTDINNSNSINSDNSNNSINSNNSNNSNNISEETNNNVGEVPTNLEENINNE